MLGIKSYLTSYYLLICYLKGYSVAVIYTYFNVIWCHQYSIVIENMSFFLRHRSSVGICIEFCIKHGTFLIIVFIKHIICIQLPIVDLF